MAQRLLGIASDRKWIRYAHKDMGGMFPALPHYDQIRSDAVHGGNADLISEEMLRRLARDVVTALDEYLDLARELRLNKQVDLFRFLDCHVDRQNFADWLLVNAHPEGNFFHRETTPSSQTRRPGRDCPCAGPVDLLIGFVLATHRNRPLRTGSVAGWGKRRSTFGRESKARPLPR